MRYMRWMKLISDYNYTIEYHPDKVDVVVDTLSWKSYWQLTFVCAIYIPLLIELRSMCVIFVVDYQGALLAYFQVRPVLTDRVREAQDEDP